METVPDDLICNILLHLPVEDLLRLSRASKRFQTLLNSESCGGLAWKQLFQQTFPEEAAGQAAPAQQHQQQQQQQQEGCKAQGQPGKRPKTEAAHAGSSAGGSSGHGSRNSGNWALPALPAPTAQQPVRGLPVAGAGEQQAGSWKEKFRERYVERRRQERLRHRARTMKLESSVQVLSQEVHRLQAGLREEQRRLEAAQREVAAIQAERQAQAARSISCQYWLPEAVQRAQGMVTTQTPVDLEGRLTDASQRVAVCALEVRKLRNQVRQRSARLEEERRKLAALQP